jgi:cytoskeletal protein CcmA (bactofilin family)
VIGDLTTAQIIIEDGAYFKGSIEIDRAADKETDNNVSPGTTFRPTTSAAAGAGPTSI